MMKNILCLACLLFSGSTLAQLALDQQPPIVSLTDKAGGRVDGASWSSAELKGKVHILMYVDPDEVKLNAHVEDALAAESFLGDLVASVGVINMAASWKPNFAIDLILKRKQKKFPDTIYVRDMQRAVVSGWDLRDHSYHIVALDREGRLIFEAAGEPSATQIGQLIAVIWDRIKD